MIRITSPLVTHTDASIKAHRSFGGGSATVFNGMIGSPKVGSLARHSKSKTSVAAISKSMKRTPGALRQKARVLGIALGHRR